MVDFFLLSFYLLPTYQPFALPLYMISKKMLKSKKKSVPNIIWLQFH